MSQGPTKIFVQVESAEEQQEHLKASRKTLKVIQKAALPVAINKENLTGRVSGLDGPLKTKEALVHASTAKDGLESKRKKLTTSASQTSPEQSKTITAEDLTSEAEPVNEEYWKVLAEKRRVALEETLEENTGLVERMTKLEEELNLSHQMLDETRQLVEVLTEMLQEGADGTETTDQADETASDD